MPRGVHVLKVSIEKIKTVFIPIKNLSQIFLLDNMSYLFIMKGFVSAITCLCITHLINLTITPYIGCWIICQDFQI